ncbi:MAG: serine/threonine protein kinase [Deltaproteobacteria bacterium]|nr:serine/threonine protein kinase [Deltaproteobacteria bacterium]
MSEAERNHDPLIGATLGGLYHVERLIGVGGMGRVYEATHTHLGKAFAVKVLPEGRADKPDATERFLREAKLATKIDHDHIVKIVNFDSDDEHRGIVHRDLKPENIFITQKNGKDFVKVLDFGISKIKNPEHGDPKLTATDQIVGTPLYISPELARGVSSVDHRTDIYGLGVIMYEMITGSPPFTGQNHFQLLYKHGNEAPDPPSQRSKKANIPAHVESAVLCALEKDPDDRFDSMSDFRAALEGPTVPRRARTLGVPLLVAAVVAGVAFVLWPSPAPEEPSEPEVPVPAPVTEKSDDPAETSQTEAPVELVKIELNSRPGRAFVALNGEKMGRTPLTLELEPGVEATVRFSLQGYRAQEHRLVPSKDDALVVRLKQKSRPKPPPIKTDF